MKTSSAKAKGRRLQQEVVAKIIERFQLQSSDVRSNPMGSCGEDVWLSYSARVQFPFSVECKNQESISIHACLEQAQRNAQGFKPLLVFKRNKSETYVALKLDDFLSSIK